MSYHHTLEAAVESLHDIERLIIRFPENGKIPSVEIDLALQKLRNLYELLLLMKDAPVVAEVVKSAPIVTFEETKQEIVVEKQAVEEPDPEVNVKETITEDVKKTAAKTLADQFKARTTLLETLSQTYKHESETIAHVKPITDLMAAIALNDRFTFIRELFNNDKKAFESAIAVLNDAASFNDAYNFMISQFNWDMGNEAVQLLLGIIRRKFISGRDE